ncbi:PREDICTED: glycolipid transfer protein 3 [Brassica oleracea var. oleracea]|uniref:Glycolipid transfer protein domain-containing protein n=1 Tax=Brassica oleracea var. oleracea TaxID=109376 RepID=A0A0D3CHM0_BRAOL|nr:PREDICTED: glycolipid transfer protein 3 [Brassica oleracea var. oleracea]
MKRKRCDMEEATKKKKMTEIGSAIEELSLLSIAKTTIVTTKIEATNIINLPLKPLLSFCKLIVQVLDKIGPTMAVLRQDIDQNIQRLEKMWETDPIVYSNLVEILRKEAKEGSSKKPKSCSRAAVWLNRAMDFTLALLQRLVKDMSQNMQQAVEESYNSTIKPWHGWISCAAFKVALKLVPNNNTFINVLAGKDESYQMVQDDIRSLISLLIPLLSQLHSILELYEVHKLKST